MDDIIQQHAVYSDSDRRALKLAMSLSLLRGARGRAELVREGEDAATVDACFEPSAALWPRLRAGQPAEAAA